MSMKGNASRHSATGLGVGVVIANAESMAFGETFLFNIFLGAIDNVLSGVMIQ